MSVQHIFIGYCTTTAVDLLDVDAWAFVTRYVRIVVANIIDRIGVSHTACKDEFRRNLRSHSWSVFSFFIIVYGHLVYSHRKTTRQEKD